jgi:hypothetical protein
MLGRLGLARFLAATLPSLRGLPGISPQGDNKDMGEKKWKNVQIMLHRTKTVTFGSGHFRGFLFWFAPPSKS